MCATATPHFLPENLENCLDSFYHRGVPPSPSVVYRDSVVFLNRPSTLNTTGRSARSGSSSDPIKVDVFARGERTLFSCPPAAHQTASVLVGHDNGHTPHCLHLESWAK